MKTPYFEMTIAAALSHVMAILFIVVFSKYAAKLRLMDMPSERKMHEKAVPLVGGISIMLASFLSLLMSELGVSVLLNYLVPFSALLLVFFTALWDDRIELSAKFRLLIQVLAALAVAASGIRIESFYGLFGLQEIPLVAQYALTVVVLTGVTNAFNLVDGIDGLAGGLSAVNLLVLLGLSLVLEQVGLACLFLVFLAAIVSFLRKNKAPAQIYMGDAGSMGLGFFMATGAIEVLRYSTNAMIDPSLVLVVVLALFIIPVLDALRVFIARFVQGISIFNPDKTHLHHLLLFMGLGVNEITIWIVASQLALAGLMILMSQFMAIELVLMAVIAVFVLLGKMLWLNKKMVYWQGQLREHHFTS